MLASTLWWWKFWKLLHLVGVLGFLAAHGATAAVALRLRREREPVRVRAMLDLSASTRSLMAGSLLLLLVGGIAGGFALHAWGQGWIWMSLGLLTVLVLIAFPLAVPYYRKIRVAVAASAPPMPEEHLAALLRSTRPLVIAWVETAGLAVILWLMVWKPF